MAFCSSCGKARPRSSCSRTDAGINSAASRNICSACFIWSSGMSSNNPVQIKKGKTNADKLIAAVKKAGYGASLKSDKK